MKKLYFIIPIVCAGIFFFFYLSERNEINARAETNRLEQEAKREALRKREEEVREQARKEALVQAEKRALEREAKRKEEDRQKAEVQAAQDALANAKQERERQYKEYLRFSEDRTVAQDQLQRARDQLKLQQSQIDYLKTTVKDAADKKRIYEQTLAKLETAERQYASNEAAKLAAAAVPKK